MRPHDIPVVAGLCTTRGLDVGGRARVGIDGENGGEKPAGSANVVVLVKGSLV